MSFQCEKSRRSKSVPDFCHVSCCSLSINRLSIAQIFSLVAFLFQRSLHARTKFKWLFKGGELIDRQWVLCPCPFFSNFKTIGINERPAKRRRTSIYIHRILTHSYLLAFCIYTRVLKKLLAPLNRNLHSSYFFASWKRKAATFSLFSCAWSWFLKNDNFSNSKFGGNLKLFLIFLMVHCLFWKKKIKQKINLNKF